MQLTRSSCRTANMSFVTQINAKPFFLFHSLQLLFEVKQSQFMLNLKFEVTQFHLRVNICISFQELQQIFNKWRLFRNHTFSAGIVRSIKRNSFNSFFLIGSSWIPGELPCYYRLKTNSYCNAYCNGKAQRRLDRHDRASASSFMQLQKRHRQQGIAAQTIRGSTTAIKAMKYAHSSKCIAEP